jgi:predicted HTH transcriptional regulator
MKGTSSEERRKNIDVVKGLIGPCFVDAQNGSMIYGNHATSDIEAIIRRSEIELSDYELKQGYLTLSTQRGADANIFDKVLKTICAIANNGPNRMGKVIIGVTDKEQDAVRIAEIDSTTPKKIGKRFVVGVKREAHFLNVSVEEYLSNWKKAIRTSALSTHLRDSVLSSIDFNDFYGLGIIVITIPPQKEMSYLDDQVYWRDADSTCQADAAKQIAAIAIRF